LEDQVPISVRIPANLHNKLLKLSRTRTKTEIIIYILEKYFQEQEKNESIFKGEIEKKLIDDLDKIFSLGEKIFMPKKVYKQILQKSESKIEAEIQSGIVDSVSISNITFIVIESNFELNSIVVEQILQKKEIVVIKKRLDFLAVNHSAINGGAS
jgi:predicted DNA-binding protein